MKVNRLIFFSALAFILFISYIPNISFADGSVTIVQDNSNSQQSNSQATCTLLSPISAHNTLVVSLDAVFINNPVTSIQDNHSTAFSSIGFALNSASTWVRVWSGVATGTGIDLVTINYTSPGNGSYGITCDEFAGNVTFVNIGGQGASLNGCNQCNMNLSASIHSINLIVGWSESSTFGYTNFAYSFLSMTAKSGSGSCQAIGGSGNCIVIFHAESNLANAITSDSAVILSCSPACNQNPNFEMDFYTSSVIPFVVTSTITGFLVPNFVNGQTSFSWLYFLIVVLVPMAEIIGVITMERSSVLDRHAIIFIFLGLLLLDSIFGVMLNVVTVAMPFIFGLLFGIYLWRGRG